jgi:ankyrin repeat protein
LCQDKYTPKQLRSHLGRHLEQIALFILPESSEENEDSGSDQGPDSDDAEISTAPDTETKSRTASLGRRFQGGLFTAEHFFKTGTGINAFDGEGFTPIHKAARAGDVKRATLLLESGCDPLAITKDGSHLQPLHIAAKNGHAELTNLLLKQSTIDINSKDKTDGKTALSWACQYGHEAVVKLLLRRKDVEVNAKDKEHGKSALIWACQNGHEGVVELLLAQEDVEVNAKDEGNGQSALSWAGETRHEGVVKLLLARDDAEVNAKDKKEKTALMHALDQGKDEIAKLLRQFVDNQKAA